MATDILEHILRGEADDFEVTVTCLCSQIFESTEEHTEKSDRNPNVSFFRRNMSCG